MRPKRQPDAPYFEYESAAKWEEEHAPLSAEEMEIHKRAKKQENERPTFMDFEDIYSKRETRADVRRLLEMKSKEEEKEKPARSRIAEYTIAHQAESSNWLGENCSTYFTSEYDDVVNHTDLVVEWNEEEEPIRLAVDVTSSQRTQRYMEKKDEIRMGLDTNHLTEVKYYESAADGKRGKIEGLPKVVLALDREQIGILSEDMINKKPREMEKDPKQLLLLEQIKYQMVDQINYSLGMTFEEINKQFHKFSGPQREELSVLLKKFDALGEDVDPEKLIAFVDDLTNTSFADKSHFLKGDIATMRKMKQVLNISERLIKEKSGLLGQEAVQQAAGQYDNNVVLRQPRSKKPDVPLELLEGLAA